MLDHTYYGSSLLARCTVSGFGNSPSPKDPMDCGNKHQWKASVRNYITDCAGYACDGRDRTRGTDCSPARELVHHALQRARLQLMFDRELQLLMRFHPEARGMPERWKRFIGKWQARLRGFEGRKPEVTKAYERTTIEPGLGFRFEDQIRSLQSLYQGHKDNYREGEREFKRKRPEIAGDRRAYRYKHVYEFLVAERTLNTLKCTPTVTTFAAEWMEKKGERVTRSSLSKATAHWHKQMRQTEEALRIQYPEFGESGSWLSRESLEFQDKLYPRRPREGAWQDNPCLEPNVRPFVFQAGEFNGSNMAKYYGRKITRTPVEKVLGIHDDVMKAFDKVQGHIDGAVHEAIHNPGSLTSDPIVAALAQATFKRGFEKNLVRFVKCDRDNRDGNMMWAQIGGMIAINLFTKGLDKVALVADARGAASAAAFATRSSLVLSKTVALADNLETTYSFSKMALESLNERRRMYSVHAPLQGSEWK